MAAGAPRFFNNAAQKLLLFGGKGGVGKTTTAAATALGWAAKAAPLPILIVSTDPAHSLGDSFAQPIGDLITLIDGTENLFAREIDAAARLETFKLKEGALLRTIADRGTYFDQEDIDKFFDLSLPGLDELIAIIEIALLVQEQRYRLVIIDTAPTGHTLRLLALPALLADWLRVLDLMLAKHRYMISVFRPYRPDETDAFLTQWTTNLQLLHKLLTDKEATEFVPVMLPEAMSIAETERLVQQLGTWQIAVQTIFVNRMLAESACPYCEERSQEQKKHLLEIKARFSAYEIRTIPLFSSEIQGQAALKTYLQAILETEAQAPEPKVEKFAQKTSQDKLETNKISDLSKLKLILFGGKGGVGKTTMAAATGIQLARQNPAAKILLFSTDPAHSLADSFAQPIGNQITAIDAVPGLFALEMNASELFKELQQTYATDMQDLFSALTQQNFDVPFDRQVMEELIYLTPPGLDEVLALLKITDFMAEARFETYLLDLAPTGHALRFLETPKLVRQWFTTFFKLLLKYQGVVELPPSAEMLRVKAKQLRQISQLLTNSDLCQFILVTLPESLALLETQRLHQQLATLGVACRWMIINMLLPPSNCAFCRTIQGAQQQQWKTFAQRALSPVPVLRFPHEIRGLAALTRLTENLFENDHG